MAYINPDILEEDWDALGTWNDSDTNGGVSSISPAGQLYLDLTNMSADGVAQRDKDYGSLGTGDYYVEIRFKIDVDDGYDAGVTHGIHLAVHGGSNQLYVGFSNGFGGSPAGDGIAMHDGTTYNHVYTETWDTNFHTVVFYVHNSQTDCDIWVDKDPSEAADVTDADCSTAAGDDGNTVLAGWGSYADSDGAYHIDYLYIGSGLLITEFTTSATDVVSLASSAAKAAAFNQVPVSVISTPDTVTRTTTFAKTVTSVLTLKEVVTGALGRVVTAISTITVTATRALVDLVGPLWSKVNRSADPEWTGVSKNTTTMTEQPKSTAPTWTKQDKS